MATPANSRSAGEDAPARSPWGPDWAQALDRLALKLRVDDGAGLSPLARAAARAERRRRCLPPI